MSVWIVDTSPLIFLAKLNRQDLLREISERQVEEARRDWLRTRAVEDRL